MNNHAPDAVQVVSANAGSAVQLKVSHAHLRTVLQSESAMSRLRASETLGDVIVPVVNRLQDIFAQVDMMLAHSACVGKHGDCIRCMFDPAACETFASFAVSGVERLQVGAAASGGSRQPEQRQVERPREPGRFVLDVRTPSLHCFALLP